MHACKQLNYSCTVNTIHEHQMEIVYFCRVDCHDPVHGSLSTRPRENINYVTQAYEQLLKNPARWNFKTQYLPTQQIASIIQRREITYWWPWHLQVACPL